jgi:hypothetical protein
MKDELKVSMKQMLEKRLSAGTKAPPRKTVLPKNETAGI